MIDVLFVYYLFPSMLYFGHIQSAFLKVIIKIVFDLFHKYLVKEKKTADRIVIVKSESFRYHVIPCAMVQSVI